MKHSSRSANVLPDRLYHGAVVMKVGDYGVSWQGSANLLCQELQAMQKGNGILLSSGTRSHVFLYEIERQSNGHFKVSVINTGAGAPVSLYATLRRFVGRKLRPRAVGSRVLSATNIPLEYLTRIEVLENIVNCESRIGVRERTRSALRRNNAIERDESNSDLQRFGTCALMPLFVWAKLKFDNVFPGANLSSVFQQRFLNYIQATLTAHQFHGKADRAANFFLRNWESGRIHPEV